MKKIIPIIILLCFLLRFGLYIAHLKSGCLHDNCFICSIYNKIEKELNKTDPNLTKEIIIFFFLIPLTVKYIKEFIKNKKFYTLVGLKIELIS